MTRPLGAAGLVDAVRAVVPERIRKRLEGGNPAEAWTWEAADGATTVTTDGGERVRVVHRATGAEVADLSCSCLLAPKCLHLLAVATSLPAEGSTGGGAATDATAAPPPPPPERPMAPEAPPATLDAGQRSALSATLRSARAVLAAGAVGVGATAVDDLQRAVHACRATALYRPARSGQRVLTGLADLRAARPQFELAQLAEDLRELLWTTERLARGAGRTSDVGTGRRQYEPAGTLRLHGIACEPVAASTGHGGTSTLLVDGAGELYTVSDVRPGGAARARATYEAAAQIGGATLPHRELARHGLFVQNATRSADGRLGMGEGVRAVRAGRSSFDDPPIARRFAEPVARQLQRPDPTGLLFLTVTLLGAGGLGSDAEGNGNVLVAAVEGLRNPVRLVAPTDHQEFAFVDNLRLLSRAPALRVRLVARPAGRRRTLAVLAIAPAPDDPRLRLPDDFGGRVSLGYDVLRGAHVDGLQPHVLEVTLPDDDALDPLAPFRRRVERVVLGGRHTLPGAAAPLVEREAAQLRSLHLGGGAELLTALFRARLAREPEVLSTEWLRAATWVDAVGTSLATTDWGA